MPVTRSQSRNKSSTNQEITLPHATISDAPKRENYRGFYITKAEMKQRVDKFFEMHIPPAGETKQIADVNFSDEMTILEKEYGNQRMWDLFFNLKEGKPLPSDISADVSAWKQTIIRTFIGIVASLLNDIEKARIGTPSSDSACLVLETTFIPFFLKFSLVMTFFLSDNKKFREVFARKFLEICQQGSKAGFLIFAKFRPDMVTPECYPAINSTPYRNIYESCKSVYAMDIYKPLLEQYGSYFN